MPLDRRLRVASGHDRSHNRASPSPRSACQASGGSPPPPSPPGRGVEPPTFSHSPNTRDFKNRPVARRVMTSAPKFAVVAGGGLAWDDDSVEVWAERAEQVPASLNRFRIVMSLQSAWSGRLMTRSTRNTLSEIPWHRNRGHGRQGAHRLPRAPLASRTTPP